MPKLDEKFKNKLEADKFRNISIIIGVGMIFYTHALIKMGQDPDIDYHFDERLVVVQKTLITSIFWCCLINIANYMCNITNCCCNCGVLFIYQTEIIFYFIDVINAAQAGVIWQQSAHLIAFHIIALISHSYFEQQRYKYELLVEGEQPCGLFCMC